MFDRSLFHLSSDDDAIGAVCYYEAEALTRARVRAGCIVACRVRRNGQRSATWLEATIDR
jgi:hypothetical protein